MITMEKVYLDAQAACGLNVGDYVKVVRKAESHEAGWGNEWNVGAGKLVGETCKVWHICIYGIELQTKNMCYYYVPYFVLEKVEKPVHEFKPFDRVLVRTRPGDGRWECGIFSNIIKMNDGSVAYRCINSTYEECIPYEGNAHLLGTTDMSEDI